MRVNILYFASLREQLNASNESLEVAENTSLNDLKLKLAQRGGVWEVFLAEQADGSIFSAVNQRKERDEFKVKAGDEIAFFPPVTGG